MSLFVSGASRHSETAQIDPVPEVSGDGSIDATAEYPCVTCGNPKYCFFATYRGRTRMVCREIESDTPHPALVNGGLGEGWYHDIADGRKVPPRDRPREPLLTPAQVAEIHQSYTTHLHATVTDPPLDHVMDHRIYVPAGSYAAALDGLGRTTNGYDALTWPEYDGSGTVIGIMRRFVNEVPGCAKKQQVYRTSRGLTVPIRFAERAEAQGTVLVVEGESDVVALDAAGLCAIGRPGAKNKDCVPMLVQYLTAHAPGAKVIVVAERDAAGREGSTALGEALRAAGLDSEVRECPVPALSVADPKDPRGYLTDLSLEDLPWAERGAEFLHDLGASGPPVAPVAPADPDAAEPTAEPIAGPIGAGSIGFGACLVATYGHDIRYVEAERQWYIWDGCRWAADRTRLIDVRAKEIAKAALARATDAAEHKAALAFQSARAVRDAIEMAKSEPAVARTPEQFDARTDVIVTADGTIDLRTGELRPSDREDHLTQKCPTRYRPDAKCPTFDTFLAGVFQGVEDQIGFIQRLLGYALTGCAKEDVVAILYGGGANGKSTLIEAIRHVVGRDYSRQMADGVLTSTGAGSNHSTDVADLKGTRMAFLAETDDGATLKKAQMKKLSGGDEVTARHLYQRNQTFSQTWTMFLQTNNKPSIPGGGHGEWRRLKLINFPNRFVAPADATPTTPVEQIADSGLSAKLEAEAEGILAWLVRGAVEYHRSGLQVPTCVVASTDEYRAEEDVVGAFCADLVPSNGSQVTCSGMYAQFCRTLEGSLRQEDIPSSKKFVREMELRGWKRDSQRKHWTNVKLTALSPGRMGT